MASGPTPKYQETQGGPNSATQTHIPKQESDVVFLWTGVALWGLPREDIARMSRAGARIQRIQATQG
eukprot:7649871-Pyramimonas_sp.AAC.1